MTRYTFLRIGQSLVGARVVEVAEEDGDAADAPASPPPTFPFGIGFLCIFNIVTLAELRGQEKRGGGKQVSFYHA